LGSEASYSVKEVLQIAPLKDQLQGLISIKEASQLSGFTEDNIRKRIRNGELDIQSPGLAEHLWQTTLAKMKIDQPNYASYRREREAPWLPPWRDLLRVYRRLEGRGEIRGGRFVAGFSGEQFALPEAIGPLREARRKPASGALVSLSGADPLNLVGILTPGPRLAALTGNRLLYRDGVPIALLAGGELAFLTQLTPAAQWEAQNLLLRRAVPAALADLA
jgi:hypothetical protein